MTKEEQNICQALVCRYKGLKRDAYKNKIRDELYFELSNPLHIWIRSILKKWYISQTDNEVLSLSWHCFLYALDKYKNIKIPLPYHFYTYTMYYLYQEFTKNNRELTVEATKIEVNNPDLCIKELYDKLPERPRQILKDILTQQSTMKTKGNYYNHKRQLKTMLKRLYS